MLQKIKIGLICLFLISIACKKEEEAKVRFEVIYVGENINVHRVIFLSDSVGYACGGKQFEYGTILRTTDKGNSWKNVYVSHQRCIYDLHFINDSTGYAGGDTMLLLSTKDRGESWQSYWFYPYPPHKPQRTAFKNFFFISNDLFYIVGGQNFDAGLVYKTTDAGRNWTFTVFENELKGVSFSDSLNGFVSGNGVIYKTNDGGLNYQLMPVKEDFFTSVWFADKNNGVAVGYNGGIYQTRDAGNSWKTILQPNRVFEKRIHFNDLSFDYKNRGYAVGTEGLIMFTDDGGSSWKSVEKFTDDDLLTVTIIRNNELLITSVNGKIYKVFF